MGRWSGFPEVRPMTPDANQVKAIFLAAVENCTPDQWAAYLDEACAGEDALRRRVEVLLQAHAGADSLFDHSGPSPVTTVDEPAVAERPGMVIGPYKLLEQIGEGGFGVVFMAEQQQPVRRKVALKVVKPGMDSKQVIARFEAERQALALMDHPHIAKVLDAGQTGSGRPYFVMDLVRGLPITDYCDQAQLTPRERLELFLHVCQAVQHAHQKGIIHRDLKPSNVLVTQQDGAALVKVIDFGIAKALGGQLTDKTLFTGFAQMVGTPLYMSPEQAALSNVDVDTRSDVYGLGVLLYELLTGTTPFDRDRLRTAGYDEIRRIIVDEEPPKPSTRVSTMGKAATTISANRKSEPRQLRQLFRGELDWIVMKALEKDRNRRYESASAFAADVQRYLHDEPVLAYPPSAWYRFRKLARRNKAGLLVAMSLALGLLLALGGLVTAVLVQAAGNVRIGEALGREQVTSDELRRVLAEKDDNLYFHRIALAERELAANRSARAEELLNQCPSELRGWEWHLLKRQIHEEPLVLAGHSAGVPGVAFSPNGLVLASSCWDSQVRLWDPGTGKPLRALPEKPLRSSPDAMRAFQGVAFSPNGQFLAVACWDGTVFVWDLAANHERVLKGHAGGRATWVAFSPDNRHLASASLDKTVIIWDLKSEAQRVLTGHTDGVSHLAYTPDGERLATASADRTVRVWDVRTGRTVSTLTGHRSGVECVAFSRDGRYLASGSRDRTVRLWDAAGGTPLAVMTGHTSEVNSVAFSPDGRRLATGHGDGTVRLWDPATGQEALTLRGHRGCVYSVAFSPDGWRLASSSHADNNDNVVRVWNAKPGAEEGPGPLRTLTGHRQEVTCLAFNRDGRVIASGSLDRTVRVHDTATGDLVQTFNGDLNTNIAGVAISPDGTHLAAVGDQNGLLIAWDLRSRRKVYARPFPTDLSGLSYSPDGKRLAVADEGHYVHVLDASNGKSVARLDGLTTGVHAVAYQPDGKRLAAGCTDQTVLVWDVETGKLQTLKGHEADVLSVAYRPDGKWLASADGDGWVIVWNATSENAVNVRRRIHAHRDTVNCVRFSPDGRRLATASRDGTVKLWDAASGALVRVLRAGQGEVFAVAFHPNGKTLASAGADGTVKLLEVPPP
jgi:WD40 repeat protein/serine/threonine protein kinase